jgi:hypothetical protein
MQIKVFALLCERDIKHIANRKSAGNSNKKYVRTQYERCDEVILRPSSLKMINFYLQSHHALKQIHANALRLFSCVPFLCCTLFLL